jgi:hypothetical protein
MKRILRYLKGTTNFGIWYPKGNYLTSVAYTNVDWEENFDDRKRRYGVAFYLGDCLVSWLSKNQSLVSLSTSEEGYIAVGTCCIQVLWMKQILQDI